MSSQGFSQGHSASVPWSAWDNYYATHDEANVLWNRGDVDENLVAVVSALGNGTSLRSALDVGCGLGHDTLFLLGHFSAVTCLDASPHALRAARARVKSALGTAPRIEFVAAYLGAHTATPLGRAPRYSLVWVRSVMQHLSDIDLRGMLNYLRILLRPGALLVAKEFDSASCPQASAIHGEVRDCNQTLGPKNTRTVPQLLHAFGTAGFHCDVAPTTFVSSCGTRVCARLYFCGVPTPPGAPPPSPPPRPPPPPSPPLPRSPPSLPPHCTTPLPPRPSPPPPSPLPPSPQTLPSLPQSILAAPAPWMLAAVVLVLGCQAFRRLGHSRQAHAHASRCKLPPPHATEGLILEVDKDSLSAEKERILQAWA